MSPTESGKKSRRTDRRAGVMNETLGAVFLRWMCPELSDASLIEFITTTREEEEEGNDQTNGGGAHLLDETKPDETGDEVEQEEEEEEEKTLPNHRRGRLF